MGCGVITKEVEALGGIKDGVNVMEDVSENFAGAGVRVKQTRIPKGYQVYQHKHSYAHLSILVSGFVKVETDDHTEILDATDGSKSILIGANEYHKVTAYEDSVWMCIHRDEK